VILSVGYNGVADVEDRSRPDAVPRSPVGANGHHNGAAGRKLAILVVDDDPDAGDSLGLVLQLQDHAVRIARNGPAALAAAEELWPDVVLLDLAMPEMTGYEVARRLAQESGTRAKPLLIAISGYGRDVDRDRSRAEGIDFHLIKPVDLDVLQDLLKAVAVVERSTDVPATSS
jgi:CheY-like chemotaxis protein